MAKPKNISTHELIRCARELISVHGENVEYDRALAELLSLAFYGTTEHARLALASLRGGKGK